MSDPARLSSAGRGATFRDGWRDAPPAGRRRAADLATGVVRLDAALRTPRRRPRVPVPDPDRWAAALRADGTFAPRSPAPRSPAPGAAAHPPAA